MPIIDQYFQKLIELGGSDLHLSQNQPAANRDGVIAGLQALGTFPAAAMAAEVAERLKPPCAD